MKIFYIFLMFSTLFTGCVDKNAFTRFHMNEKQELGADSILNAKVKIGDKTEGIISVIYLNKISPEIFNEEESFYVYYYLKDANAVAALYLNKQKAISIEELPSSNKFTYLTKIDTKWNKYYLVKFAKQTDILRFVLESGQSSSDPLVFEKDE